MRLRPDLRTVTIRGNVDTRLAKVERGEVDATLLAAAGLDRLGRPEVGVAIELIGHAARAGARRDRDRMPRAMTP